MTDRIDPDVCLLTPWPEADARACAALWALGWTSSAIAKELGRTRNAIIGKIHRMKLPKRDAPTDKHDSSRSPNRVARTRKAADEFRATRKAIWLERTRPAAVYFPVLKGDEDETALPPPAPVRFLDRRDGQCCWPKWQAGEPLITKMVCGNHTNPEGKTPGLSYCAGCVARATQPFILNRRAA